MSWHNNTIICMFISHSVFALHWKLNVNGRSFFNIFVLLGEFKRFLDVYANNIIIHCGWNVTCNSSEICRLRDLTFFSDDHQIFILHLTLWVYCIVRLQLRIIIIVYHSMSLLYYRNWAQLSHGSFSVHIKSISSYFHLIFCDPRPLSSFTLYPIDL